MTTVRHLLDRKGRAIFSVGPEDPVLEAIRLMAEHHVGALLVTRGEAVLGIISERPRDRDNLRPVDRRDHALSRARVAMALRGGADDHGRESVFASLPRRALADGCDRRDSDRHRVAAGDAVGVFEAIGR